MFMGRTMGGEGATTLWIRAVDRPSMGVIVSPLCTGEVGMDPQMIQEIYRVAYEWARAALQPSAYEIARHPCWN